MLPHRGLHGARRHRRRAIPRPCGRLAKSPFCARLEGLAHRRPWRHLPVIVSTQFRRLAGVAARHRHADACRRRCPHRGPRTTSRRFQTSCRRRVNWRALSIVRQLSRRASCRHAARRRRRRRLLPRGAAHRSEEHRAAAARLPLGAGGRRRRGSGRGSPSRWSQLDRNDRIARLVIGVQCAQAEEISPAPSKISRSRCAARSPISPPRCSPPGRAMARATPRPPSKSIDKLQGADWYALFKDLHAGLILDLVRQQEGSRQALRARPQARRHRAAAGRGLRLLAVAQRQEGRGAEGVQGVRRATAAPSADRRGDGRRQARASRCRRWSTRRRPARPKCSMGSARRSAGAAARTWASSISSLRSISRPTSRWRCCRSPISTSR